LKNGWQLNGPGYDWTFSKTNIQNLGHYLCYEPAGGNYEFYPEYTPTSICTASEEPPEGKVTPVHITVSK